jgi:malonyl-CoA O-methyltransferase
MVAAGADSAADRMAAMSQATDPTTELPAGRDPGDWLDVAAARRGFGRAAASVAGADALAREIARRMAERLAFMRITPGRILDLGCGAGADLPMLESRYQQASIIGLDSAPALLVRRAASGLGRLKSLFSKNRHAQVCADQGAQPFASGAFDMVWSNLALAWTSHPQQAFAELARVLKPGGLLMFSTYGPDTLRELRAAFATVDSAPHVHPFIDMHDLGDMLAGGGFATPVMDMEVVTLTYDSVDGLFADLRATGQTNAARDRRRALLGHRAAGRLRSAYEATRRDGRLPATFEIIYGHAWRGEPRVTPDGRSIIKFDRRHGSGTPGA